MELTDLEKYKSNANTDSEGYCGGSAPVPVVRSRRVWGFWVIIVLLAGVCGLLAFLWYDSWHMVRNYRNEAYDAASQISSLEAQNDSLASLYQYANEAGAEFRSMVADNYALIVNNIEFKGTDGNGNLDIPVGNSLVSSELRYLHPIVKYTGIKPGTRKFDIRFMNSDETIRKGNGSPTFYTYSTECEVQEGPNQELVLSGWGNTSKGTSWSPGNYRIEVWSEGKCYTSRSFIIR